jgi:hypothetical protein
MEKKKSCWDFFLIKESEQERKSWLANHAHYAFRVSLWLTRSIKNHRFLFHAFLDRKAGVEMTMNINYTRLPPPHHTTPLNE